MARLAGVAWENIQAPARVMPTGTASNRCGSRLRRMLPADTHEMECSLLRPPKTTATRTLPRGGVDFGWRSGTVTA